MRVVRVPYKRGPQSPAPSAEWGRGERTPSVTRERLSSGPEWDLGLPAPELREGCSAPSFQAAQVAAFSFQQPRRCRRQAKGSSRVRDQRRPVQVRSRCDGASGGDEQVGRSKKRQNH